MKPALLFLAISVANSVYADDTVELNTVTVVAPSNPLLTSQSVDVVGAEELQGQSRQWLPDVLKSLPNVDVIGDNNNPTSRNVTIRGLDKQYIAVTVDGARNTFNSPKGGSFTLPANLFKQVTVVKGPSSGAAAGLIRMETKDAADLLEQDEKFGADFALGVRSNNSSETASATVYGQNGQFDFLASGSRVTTQNMHIGDGVESPQSEMHGTSSLAKIGTNLSDSQRLFVSHSTYSGSDKRTRLDTEERERFARNTVLGYDATLSEYVDLTTRLYRNTTQHNTFDRESGDLSQDIHKTVGLSINNNSVFGSSLISSGLEYYKDSIEPKARTEGVAGTDPTTEPTGEVKNSALYAIVQQPLIDDLELIASLRYDTVTISSSDAVDINGAAVGRNGKSKSQLSKGLMITWEADPGLELFASYSEALVAPRLTELYVSGKGFKPNPGLKPVQAQNKEIGFVYAESNLFSEQDKNILKLNVFSNDLKNYIGKEYTDPDYKDGVFVNMDSVNLRGFELINQYQINTVSVTASYGKTRGYDSNIKQPIFDMPSDKIKLDLGWDATPEISTNLVMVHALKLNHAPEKGYFKEGRGAPVQFGTLPAKYDQTTPAWTTLDWFLSYQPEASDLSVNMSVTNLTDRSYAVRYYAEEDVNKYYEEGRSVNISLGYQF